MNTVPVQFAHTNLSFAQVFDGEYDLPLKEPPKTVLDIGANEGAFTAWALKRWPYCWVTAYEPVPQNATVFKRNHDCTSNVTFFQCAVGNSNPMTLHLGKNNSGECSAYDIGEQVEESISVPCEHPSMLKRADFIKIDTEGCELEILEGLDTSMSKGVVLEYHNVYDMAKIVLLMYERGFDAVSIKSVAPQRGILKFSHMKDLICPIISF